MVGGIIDQAHRVTSCPSRPHGRGTACSIGQGGVERGMHRQQALRVGIDHRLYPPTRIPHPCVNTPPTHLAQHWHCKALKGGEGGGNATHDADKPKGGAFAEHAHSC